MGFKIGSVVSVKSGVFSWLANKRGTIIGEYYTHKHGFWWVKFSNVYDPMWFRENELILESRGKIDLIWEEKHEFSSWRCC